MTSECAPTAAGVNEYLCECGNFVLQLLEFV